MGETIWECPHCGSKRVDVMWRHPADPAKDQVRCPACKSAGFRYEFFDPSIILVEVPND